MMRLIFFLLVLIHKVPSPSTISTTKTGPMPQVGPIRSGLFCVSGSLYCVYMLF